MNNRVNKGFGMVSNTVIRNPEISLREKAIYAYLSSYANSNNELTVSVNRIAEECGITPSTVKRIVDSLIKKGVIGRIKRGIGQSYKTILLK
jgi:DNA-binding MarR family transcriptional regulator